VIEAGVAGLDECPVGICLFDAAGRLQLANAAWRAGTLLDEAAVPVGMLRPTFLGLLAARGLLGPGDPAQLVQAMLRPAATARPMRRRRPDGSWVLVHRATLPDGSLMVTITETTRIERMRESAERAATVLDQAIGAIPGGLAVADTQGRLMRLAPALARLLGLPPGPGFPTMAALLEAVEQCSEPAGPGQMTLEVARGWTVQRSLGNEVVLLQLVPVPEGGSVLWATRPAEPAAPAPPAPPPPPGREAAALLRGPVEALRAQAAALRDAVAWEPRLLPRAAALDEAAQDLLLMLGAVGDLSRMQTDGFTLTLDLIEAAPVLEACLEQAHPNAEAVGLTLTQAIAPDLPPLRADPAALAQVVTHLLVNAVRFTNPGGTVRVEAAPTVSGVQISVVDTGTGIQADQLARIFEPRARRTGEEGRFQPGGLGLYLCRALVAAQGGRLEIASIEGSGTTARILLPAAGRPPSLPE
jgi:PAS domain-containing protein/anti-sigma regulatory factor (Ser/Thr protein kinase)